MASKICNVSPTLSLVSLGIENLIWIGFSICFGISVGKSNDVLLYDPLTSLRVFLPFVVYSLWHVAIMLMELFGTTMKLRKTMIVAIAFRFIRLFYCIIIGILLSHIGWEYCRDITAFLYEYFFLSRPNFETFYVIPGMTLMAWDTCKIILDFFLIPSSKQYSTILP